jgi:RHS repeat-associated protein
VRDEEVGLVFNRARMLHPALGRFMQRDPLGYVDGASLYQYLRSDPTTEHDPLGLYPWGPVFNLEACMAYCGGRAAAMGGWFAWLFRNFCWQACNNDCANEQAQWMQQNLPPAQWIDPNGVPGTDPWPNHPCC